MQLLIDNSQAFIRDPPIDPFEIESESVSVSLGEIFRASGSLRDLKIRGISKAKLVDFR